MFSEPYIKNFQREKTMKNIKVYGYIAGLSFCALFLISGCSQTAILALKFTPDETIDYRVILETQRSVEWESLSSGNLPGLKGGQAVNRIEIVYSQHVEHVDDENDAVVKITIKNLKYTEKIRDKIALDFDSTTNMNPQDPFSKLIGQSYTIEITTSGQISNIIDTNEAQAAIADISSNQKALKLLSEEAIKERHTIPALPPAETSQLCPGQTWNTTKNFSFDMMGSKAYEKIYTLEKIENPVFVPLMQIFKKEPQTHRIAIVRMNAIPSIEQADIPSPQKFDNIDTYTGQLKLDLTDSKIEEYHEKLLTEWLRTVPLPQTEEQQVLLKMSATQSYSIEKID